VNEYAYELRFVRQAGLCERVLDRLRRRGYAAAQYAPPAGTHYTLRTTAPLAAVREAAREVALIIQVVEMPEG
jgi:hypothetical protein